MFLAMVRRNDSTKEEIDMAFWGSLESLDWVSFNLKDEKSNKFWEYAHKDSKILLRSGKIGKDGNLTQKTLEDVSAVQKYIVKEVSQKKKKGYCENQDSDSE